MALKPSPAAIAALVLIAAPAAAQLAPGEGFMDWMGEEPYSSEPGCLSGAEAGFNRYSLLTDINIRSSAGGCRFTSHFPMKGLESVAVVAECDGAMGYTASMMQITPSGPERPAEVVDVRDGPNGVTTRFWRCREE